MPGRQAALIQSSVLRRVLAHLRSSHQPDRDRVIVLLSVRAGLRAAEIALLDWSMILDASGRVADVISIHDIIAKKRSGRRVPMHPELRHALTRLKNHTQAIGPVIRSTVVAQCGRTASSTGSYSSSRNSGLLDALRTPAGAPSSRRLRGMPTAPAAACVTCSYWPATARSRPRSATSTVIPTHNVGWCRCCNGRLGYLCEACLVAVRQAEPTDFCLPTRSLRRHVGLLKCPAAAAIEPSLARRPNLSPNIFACAHPNEWSLGLPAVIGAPNCVGNRSRAGDLSPENSSRLK
jgi:hypothetical protein